MSKREDIKKILVIGAGPIMIGQGCEFDYSGTQAINALKDLGYFVILVNSNAATIMNDSALADRTYIEPLTVNFLTRIIEAEKPDAILPTVGGQTALNLAIELEENGILAEFGVEMIGANASVIKKAEDRALFNDAVLKIGLKPPKNVIATSVNDAEYCLKEIGLPAIIRPSFTLGGTGGGIAYNSKEFRTMLEAALEASLNRRVQIDQSLLGWKEYELEVMRDKNGNFIVVCAIENFDPMGVHTGDSITVAPTMTLTDKEYQTMRDAAKSVINEIGLTSGGANVQFAVNPKNGDMVVIEMNPRVSRSSALASKATGYPIAKISAMLSVGLTLDEIENDCTVGIPSSFEPSLDYVVVKMPRFNFDKFPNSENELTTTMQAVGEVMSIARSFPEALQKAVCSMEIGRSGLYPLPTAEKVELEVSVSKPSDERLFNLAEFMRKGSSAENASKISGIDLWFTSQIKNDITDIEEEIKLNLNPNSSEFFKWKSLGFSDIRIAKLQSRPTKEISELRANLKIHPVFKRVDSCAGEFATRTSYLYSTYTGDPVRQQYFCESKPSNRKKIIIIGSGCNRIGQGIEFDYSCVHAAWTVRELGFESIMINCNPETVSTDYKTSDKLYFEPLDSERVSEIIRCESLNGEIIGVIVQFGGQTALKIAREIGDLAKILGTSQKSIDMSEDRAQFRQLLKNLGLKQPASIAVFTADELINVLNTHNLSLPLLIRPSNVLGGRAMTVIHDDSQLNEYLEENPRVFKTGPLLVDQFLEGATELDVDALSDGQNVYIVGIMEHIEEAGVHSGDSISVTPPPYVSPNIELRVREITKKLALALEIKGLINIQFAIKDSEIYIIEANPRASRTVPFLSKYSGLSVAKIATQIMCGTLLQDLILKPAPKDIVAVKMPVFPFLKFKDADFILGPEMRSIGEVMALGNNFEEAFAKAFISVHKSLPTAGTILISVKDEDKTARLTEITKILLNIGFQIMATSGTAKFLNSAKLPVLVVSKLREVRPNVRDFMIDKKIKLYINTSDTTNAVREGTKTRRTAMANGIPCITTINQAFALARAIENSKENELGILALQDL